MANASRGVARQLRGVGLIIEPDNITGAYCYDTVLEQAATRTCTGPPANSERGPGGPGARFSGFIAQILVPGGAYIFNLCAGTTPAMAAGSITTHAACITGTRPISLVEIGAGKPWPLTYSRRPGMLVIHSASATDTNAVSWSQQ